MARTRLTITLAAGVALVTGCADDHSPAQHAPAVVTAAAAGGGVDIDVTLQQYRADEVAHRIGIQVTNRGTTVVDVATARLDWAGLDPIEPTALDYPLVPGATVDLRVDYGEASCSDPPLVAEPVPTDPITVEVVTAGGETLRWAVDDVRGVLARVHGLDCRRQAVEHLVGVTIGREWTPNAAGDAVTGELMLTRGNASGPVRLTGISGSVLLNLDVAPGASTELTGDTLVIPIVITSARRCEAHALADSKKTYDFQVTLEVDGVDASISVGPDPADEPIVFEPVNVTCGLSR